MPPVDDQESVPLATPPSPGPDLLVELRYLALKTLDELEPDQVTGLAQHILNQLGFQETPTKHATRSLIGRLLPKVINYQRQRAVNAGHAAIAKAVPTLPFQVAAAGELIGIHDEDVFRRLRQSLGVTDVEWRALEAKEEGDPNAGPKRIRQLRAALWRGQRDMDYSSRRVRGHDKEDPLLNALIEAIDHYLQDPNLRPSIIDFARKLVAASCLAESEKYAAARQIAVDGGYELSSRAQAADSRLNPHVAEALDSARAYCVSINRKFATPHVVFALLDLPVSKTVKCFERTKSGLVAEWSAKFEYIKAPDPEGVSHKIDSNFRWEDLPEVKRAEQLAREGNQEEVGELHLLVGVLEKPYTRTRRMLAEILAPIPYERLIETAFILLEETPPPPEEIE